MLGNYFWREGLNVAFGPERRETRGWFGLNLEIYSDLPLAVMLMAQNLR